MTLVTTVYKVWLESNHKIFKNDRRQVMDSEEDHSVSDCEGRNAGATTIVC